MRSRGAARRVEIPEREVEVSRFELLWREGERAGVRDRVLLGDLRAVADRRPRRRLLPRAAADGDRPVRLADADDEPDLPLDDALAFLPAVELAGDDARRAGHGVAVRGDAAGPVRLRDEDGLIALAEPRGDGTLKPVVGFRG